MIICQLTLFKYVTIFISTNYFFHCRFWFDNVECESNTRAVPAINTPLDDMDDMFSGECF